MAQLPFKLGTEFNPETRVAATMVRNGGGFPVVDKIWLYSCKVVRKYGRYDLCLSVRFTLKGKSKKLGFRYDDVTIALGHQDVAKTFNGGDLNEELSFAGGHLERITDQLKDVLVTTIQ